MSELVTDDMVEAGLKSLDVPHWVDMTMEDDVRAILEAVAPLVAAKALRDAAETYTVTIPDALGYKVQAVFTEDLMDRAAAIEAKP